MNANALIDCYVRDVVLQLPRRQRNDVACELRALLLEDLQARAADRGQPADAALALTLVREFGRPAEVAMRYQPSLSVIDPADGPAFLRATVIGLVVIWVLGLLRMFLQPIHGGGEWLQALGQWWTGTVLRSLWWPGVLVVGFALAAWSRRRWPHSAEWAPRGVPGAPIRRLPMALAVVGIVAGVTLLAQPRMLLDLAFDGRAAPAAYLALSYTDTFSAWCGPLLWLVLLLHAPLRFAVLLRGCWTPRLQQLENLITLALCAVLVWALMLGPVFAVPASDHAMRSAMLLTLLYVGFDAVRARLRRIRPAPDPP